MLCKPSFSNVCSTLRESVAMSVSFISFSSTIKRAPSIAEASAEKIDERLFILDKWLIHQKFVEIILNPQVGSRVLDPSVKM